MSVSFSGQISWYANRVIGDSNDDGVFDSSDLVKVFAVGKYEGATLGDATFDEGDWNQDGDFTTADLVLAFQLGHYDNGAAALAVDRLLAQNDALPIM